ncbi:MAG: ferrochelatase [Bacteroidetes bacterium]|nr:ferrochelatase [Bacteroidota bacterium]
MGKLPADCKLCYRASCYETSNTSQEGTVANEKYSTSFQSRLSRNWLSPFTDNVLKNLAVSGCRRVLVVAPSFTADCLETLTEIGEEYNALFRSYGGDQLDLVPALNDDDKWADAIIEIAGM